MSRSKITSTHLWLSVAGVLLAGAISLIIQPELLPDEIARRLGDTDADSIRGVAARLTLLIVVVGLIVAARNNGSKTSKDDFGVKPPEPAVTDAQPIYAKFTETSRSPDGVFASKDRAARQVAMYGRRAENITELPQPIAAELDSLAAAAERAHELTTGPSGDDKDAVAGGEWTTDRIAAAFLATGENADVQFTRRERFTAWLFPQQTYHNRVQRVLSVIEDRIQEFPTYEAITAEPYHDVMQQGERPQSIQEVTKSGESGNNATEFTGEHNE